MNNIGIKELFPEHKQAVKLLVQQSDGINEMLKDPDFGLDYDVVSKLFEVNLPKQLTFMEESTTLWESRKNTMLLKPVISNPESLLVKSLQTVSDETSEMLTGLYEDLLKEYSDEKDVVIRREIFVFTHVLSQAVEGRGFSTDEFLSQLEVPLIESGQYVLEDIPSLETIETILTDTGYEKVLLSTSVSTANRVLLSLTSLVGHILKTLSEETTVA